MKHKILVTVFNMLKHRKTHKYLNKAMQILVFKMIIKLKTKYKKFLHLKSTTYKII